MGTAATAARIASIQNDFLLHNDDGIMPLLNNLSWSKTSWEEERFEKKKVDKQFEQKDNADDPQTANLVITAENL